MSIAMVNQSPVILYREEQWFSWWIYAALAVMAALGAAVLFWTAPDIVPDDDGPRFWQVQLPLAVLIGLSVPPVLVVGVLRMTTEVVPGELRVWFGLVPTYRHVVPIEAIRSVEPVQFRPIREHGGWGIRRDRHGDRIFTARGDRGVRLTLTDGTHLLIGSQQPVELARTLDRAIRDLV